MPQHNDMFELSVDDMDLIETALRGSMPNMSGAEINETAGSDTSQEETARRIQDLLGRLHDQKIFYRPKSGIYVGG